MSDMEWAGAAFRLLLVVVIAWNQVRLMRENESLKARLAEADSELLRKRNLFNWSEDTQVSRVN